MRIPRWTVYPALALLAVMLVLAFPTPQQDLHGGAALRAQVDARRVEGQSAPLDSERPEEALESAEPQAADPARRRAGAAAER